MPARLATTARLSQPGTRPAHSASPAHNASSFHKDSHTQAAWAAGVARIAAETVADLDTLPPRERHNATLWAEALNACANDMMNGESIPRTQPGDLTGFLRSAAP